MKNRQAAILTGMFLCMAAVTGCGSNTETQAAKQQGSEIEDTAAENTAAEGDDEKTDGKTGKTEEQNKENQIFGKIVSVSEDSITISVESVSYTHLDVYKRQPSSFAFLFFDEPDVLSLLIR